MTKCKETVSVAGVDFVIKLKNPNKGCNVGKDGRVYKVEIENFRPNKINVDIESQAVKSAVIFGSSNVNYYNDSTDVDKKQGSNKSTISEPVYPSGSISKRNKKQLVEEIKSTIVCSDNFKSSGKKVEEEISVNVL